MRSIKSKGNSTGMRTVSLNFSNFHVLNSLNNKRIKDYTVKVFLFKESKEINIVAARGFFSYEDGVFRKLRELTEESFKPVGVHHSKF
ncbi:MAG: hypothetical protein RMI01_03690 [Thermodesulfovibrio sp.]|nr:hypothetical protein [Thermodesulfovibrio sp.]